MDKINHLLDKTNRFDLEVDDIRKEMLEIDNDVVLNTSNINSLQTNQTKLYNNISNPNLLINGDFRINQRGKASYNSINKYTVDRWISASDGITIIPNENGGINITHSSNTNLMQRLELPFSMLSGKKITISGEFDGVIYSATETIPNMQPNSNTQVVQVLANNCLLSFNIRASGSNYNFYVCINVRGNVFIKYIKLEIGECATQFIPRLYNEELAACQRYYWRAKTNKSYGTFGTGTVFSASTNPNNSKLNIFIKTPMPMRVDPTYTINGTLQIWSNGFAAYNNISGQGYTAQTKLFEITTGALYTAGSFAVLRATAVTDNIELDAEIY